MDAEAINALLARGAVNAPAVPLPAGGLGIVVPLGYGVKEFPPLSPKLERITAAVTMHDAMSFSAYVNRYKADQTRLFAEPGFVNGNQARVVATLDYHLPNAPEHCAHSSTYSPRYSDQWKRWITVKDLTQVEFAEWIEDNRADIQVPEAASLLDIIRTFKASKAVEFDSVVHQPNGDTMLAYSEKTTQKNATTTMAMPTELKLGIPVYFRGSRYAVPVLVKYRVGGGRVNFSLKVDRADIIEDTAFAEATAQIAEATGIEVYLGRRA